MENEERAVRRLIDVNLGLGYLGIENFRIESLETLYNDFGIYYNADINKFAFDE